MLRLDYRLAEKYELFQQHVNLATADEWVLGTDCFLGDFEFSWSGVDLGFGAGHVPVLAVARGLYLAVADGTSYHEHYEMNRLVELTGGTVRSSHTGGVAEIDREVLRVALREFAARVVAELGEKHPGVLGNNLVTSLLDRIARDRAADPAPLVRVLPEDPAGIGARLSALLWSFGGLAGTSLAGVDVEVMPADEPVLDDQPDLADFSRPAFLAGGAPDTVEPLVAKAVLTALVLHGLGDHPAAPRLSAP